MALMSAKYLTHKFDYPLFENISFELNAQETISIVGVSGCGKSTLLHICSTLLAPQSGEVLINDKNIYTQNEDEKIRIRREEVGIIFQSHYLFKGFSAYENIELSALLCNDKVDNTLLNQLNISHVLNQKVGELSGGQQQRVSIARVLNKRPKIIFADEPTGNLDSKTANEVMDTLFEYVKQNNAGLVLVTHDNALAQRCDKRYVLENLNLKSV